MKLVRRPARSRAHRVSRAIPVLSVAALLAVCCSSTSIAAAARSSTQVAPRHLAAKPKPKKTPKRKRHPLVGKWSGTYSGAFTGNFKLHWTQTGSRLTGSITLSYPSGTYSVSGSVRGTTLSFGAVGAGATYTGTWSGKAMSGHYKTPQGGGTWSATKTA